MVENNGGNNADLAKGTDRLIALLHQLREKEAIKNKKEEKREIKKCILKILEWVSNSHERLETLCFFISSFMDPVSKKNCKKARPSDPIVLKGDGISVNFGKMGNVPSPKTVRYLETRTALHVIRNFLSNDETTMELLFYIIKKSLLSANILDILFKADLDTSHAKPNLPEILLKLYCKNVEDNVGKDEDEKKSEDKKAKIAFATMCLFVEREGLSKYRNREKWLEKLFKQCAISEDRTETLYEIFYILSGSYEMIPFPSSQFGSHELKKNLSSASSGSCPALIWGVPDEYLEFVMEKLFRRFENYNRHAGKMIDFFEKGKEGIHQRGLEMWREILDPELHVYAPRSNELDIVNIKCPILNAGAKIYRIAMVTEDMLYPEVRFRIYYKRAGINYSCLYTLTSKGTEGFDIDAPIKVLEWLSAILRAIMIDVYHSVCVKQRTMIVEKKKKKGSKVEEDSMQAYISRYTYRAHLRTLLEGQVAHYKDDAEALAECQKLFGDNVLPNQTFVKESKEVERKRKKKGPRDEGAIFSYTASDIQRLAII